MKIKLEKLKYIFLVLSTIIFAYIIVCDFIVSFSIVMNICFFAGGILLFLVYWSLDKPINKKERGPSFFYTFVTVSSICYFSAIILLIIFNVTYPKRHLPPNKKYSYIIVFGAGIANNKTTIINGRLERAISYAKKYPRCRFVLTGAKGSNEPIEEAFYMRNYMNARGIDDKQILVDPFSVNTEENIVNSLDLIKKDIMKRNQREFIITRPFKNDENFFDLEFVNIGFMSSDFHLTRINMMAKDHGIKKPYSISCPTTPIFIPYQYVREDLSLFKAFVLNQLKL